ncbi:MAG: class I adenylate-forming enzyme family protein [Oscillospiraceae bacterium]|nr:class I adenylate-forming enzyme family protein [Oscillospiraceae bacterium]
MRFAGFRQMLSCLAQAYEGAPALCFGSQELQTISFRQLFERVSKTAGRLSAENKTCIGIVADGSADCIIQMFAAVLAGRQVVMLDNQLSDTILLQLLQTTDADSVWTGPERESVRIPERSGGVPDGSGRMLFFTSGTTEQSKAALLTDASLCASAYNGSAKLPLSPGDTVLCMLPLSHVFGFVCGLLWGLSCGACVALGRGPRHYMDDGLFFRPTVLPAVPSLLGFLLTHHFLNPELHTVLVGAGDCQPALLRQAQDLGLHVCFGYGLTETSSGIAISTSGDPYAMELCPDDSVSIAPDGEILVFAPTCIMQGYYKQPEATEAVLRGGVLYTGDLGFLDKDRLLHITGRKKDVLVLADGTKIYCPEYEAALSRVLGTGDLAVILRAGRPVLVLESGCIDRSVAAARLLPFQQAHSRNQQISEILEYPKKLPRTASGKLQRWQLQEEIEHGSI